MPSLAASCRLAHHKSPEYETNTIQICRIWVRIVLFKIEKTTMNIHL